MRVVCWEIQSMLAMIMGTPGKMGEVWERPVASA